MNKYEYLFKSLNFNKIGDSYVLETFTDNTLSLNIMIASSPDVITRDHWYYTNLKKHLDDTESYKSIKSITIKHFEQNKSGNLLNINIIHDSGNSEYAMLFDKNFDKIFLETIRENRDNKLESLFKE